MNRKHRVFLIALTALTAGIFFSGKLGLATVGGPTCNVPGDYATIQGAVNDPGCTTINVAAGTYNEQVTISHTLILRGAQAGIDARTRLGTESIITNTCGPVQIEADKVTVDGFTIQGSTDPDPCFLSGIWTNPGFSGTQGGHQIVNNIVQNNISGIELDSTCVNPTLVQFNLIQNNNNPGPGSGNGIQTNFGLCNATIDSNKFSGHTNSSVLVSSGGDDQQITVSNNDLVGGTPERIIFGSVDNSAINGNKSSGSSSSGTIRLFGANSGIAITGNTLLDGTRAIWVDDPFAIGANSNITAHNNCIQGNTTAGLEVDTGGHSGTLNAETNWWGAASGPSGVGPGSGDAIIDPDGVVDFTPFLSSAPSGCPTKVSAGPASMEGDLRLKPGAQADHKVWVAAGYIFTLPGKHASTTLTFTNGKVTLPYRCTEHGATVGNVVVPLSDQAILVGMNDNRWFPLDGGNSPNQASQVTYEGAVEIGELCGPGATVFLNYSGSFGATFSANVTSSISPILVNLKFHYRAPAGKNKVDTNCSDPLDPNSGVAHSDICGAGWSNTVSFNP